MTWVTVCEPELITPGSGVAALLPDGTQVAVFRTGSGDLHALSNMDPISGASVLSRGIVGESGGVPFVASPMLKQRFDLRTGACLDDPEVSVPAYPVDVADGVVRVGSSP